MGQALALLGYRPLTPEERERAVVTIASVDAQGNPVETLLAENDQRMLDHVLDHGTATRRDIASAVLGATDAAAIDNTRSSVDNRLDNDYHLVEKAQPGKKPVIYTAQVPPPGGVVWRDRPLNLVLRKVRSYLEAHPNRWHSVAEISDALKKIEKDSARKALEALVRTGVASKEHDRDGTVTVRYRFVPEALRPEAKKVEKGDVPRAIVAFLEAEGNLGTLFTAAQISEGTGHSESSVRWAAPLLVNVDTGERGLRRAKTFGSSAVGRLQVRPVRGDKRLSEGGEGAGGAKRKKVGGGGVRGGGVGRVVSGLLDPAAAVSEGRARVLAELAGDFA
ncbi:hypothetical protein ACFXI3_47130, partial [Amycolatopsis sp. NPDC059235]|uniref:hypothetical protein n=1 Tax=Amycolatopsis sp. NPDC059235 TaxID=3346782 RepID=UPI003670B8AC